ncbi:MAG: UDP-N-acetylglucosamine 1-carboxyvinyltransferase [Candidatus Wallbacteria bacterium HGW-Wallbacteria-1]|jgi:UDP-N-acetylglucosamine 1-carboxyvinyltransferase|uniref:UDP-N-acetylglucosamine 1-carboxyvinyltransferase n=1 Tax=Candidatus Wallbacteria bacterium HGW-Wallbacteria-1 TaxID=2013854 RepID=A0A2N1PT52_9BACT|nr:MAG: UDP-N-acetylglucosamine 1-carboxyvinyltransferase [Candidatus Wallbacteria bacterium HGW-Wallbacteria-1]
MDRFIIKGPCVLKGSISAGGSKNASLPILAAALLAEGQSTIGNVPNIRDVRTMMDVLRRLGADVLRPESGSINIDPAKVSLFEAPYDLLRTMRASFLVMGPLLARFGQAKVSMPGGCAIGARPVDIHLKGFKAMGAEIDINHGYVMARADRLRGCTFHMDIASVGATENLMAAAALAKGTTVLHNAAREPEIIDMANYINAMGGCVEGAGESTITIHGVDRLHGAAYNVCSDRIEVATYMVAAAITGGDLTITDAIPPHVEGVTEKLVEAGCDITVTDSTIRVIGPKKILPVNITTQVYPGFPTDVQAQFMAMLTIADGASTITEKVFENRFMHVPELSRMGADVSVNEHTAFIKGVGKLSGAPVMASDLRAGACLVLAGLIADGETEILRVYHIDRGYDRLEKKLSAVGANIRRLK